MLGVTLGLSCGSLFLGQEVDRLTLDNAKLMDHMEYLTNRLEILDRRGALSSLYVESIEVVVHGIERDRPTVEQHLKQLLSHLLGQDLSTINAQSLHNIIERSIRIERQEYLVTVKYIYIMPTLSIYVIAEAGNIYE